MERSNTEDNDVTRTCRRTGTSEFDSVVTVGFADFVIKVIIFS